MCLAIITARGGSKRIPKKNIKAFCGKPIIAYSIAAALESSVFSEVMVSTDDPEIADIARQYGAAVPFMRSEENSGDFANTSEVICEVLAEYERLNQTFEAFCCIYPTAPFITPEKLRAAHRLLTSGSANSVIPVTAFSFPPLRSVKLTGEYLSPAFPEHFLKRSQDLDTLYHDCGQFYFVKTAPFLESEQLFMDRSVPMLIPETEVQDIDTLTDWELAERKYLLMLKEGAAE